MFLTRRIGGEMFDVERDHMNFGKTVQAELNTGLQTR